MSVKDFIESAPDRTKEIANDRRELMRLQAKIWKRFQSLVNTNYPSMENLLALAASEEAKTLLTGPGVTITKTLSVENNEEEIVIRIRTKL